MTSKSTTNPITAPIQFYLSIVALIAVVLSPPSYATKTPNESSSQQTNDKKKQSPWLFTPTLSSDPKLGTSVGALAAYIYSFDSDSPASMFGITGSYSSTDSIVGGAFARTYFDHDTQRLIAFLGSGEINNDYSDFLGTGLPVSTTDDLNIFAIKYLHQVKGDWFAGIQAANTNYTLSGDDDFSQTILEKVGLVGFDSIGVGVAAQYDTRDNQNSPTSGHSIEVNNLAYRKSFGGDSDCTNSSDLYPTAGAGISYTIKPEERMVVSVDLAYGKSDNYGFYMRFGNAF